MNIRLWADLHGEEWFDPALEKRLRKGVWCRNCQDVIEFSEMKPWSKDDETVDMLCPDCGAVLVEGE